MQQKTAYPEWYRRLKAFLGGLGAGVLLLSALEQARLFPENPLLVQLTRGWLLPMGILIVTGLIAAVFELWFAVQRHARLEREQQDGPAA